MDPVRAGGLAALSAFVLWGGLSLYLKLLSHVPALEVLAHRILGGALFSLLALALMSRWTDIRAACLDGKVMRGLAASSLAIAVNWGLFIWSVSHGRALEASLGYFIFPLVSVVLARLVLHEELTRRQGAAVVLAALGVTWLAAHGSGVPWIALVLASSFGAYGLLRKTINVPSLTGLFIETLYLAPAALGYLLWQGGGEALNADGATLGLLFLAGPVTAIPLVLFAFGARRLRLSTLGLMMYVNPTVQMLIAVFVFGEAFTNAHMVAFAAIWCGLAVYSWPSGRIRP